jgi:hypothetical protein
LGLKQKACEGYVRAEESPLPGGTSSLIISNDDDDDLVSELSARAEHDPAQTAATATHAAGSTRGRPQRLYPGGAAKRARYYPRGATIGFGNAQEAQETYRRKRGAGASAVSDTRKRGRARKPKRHNRGANGNLE